MGPAARSLAREIRPRVMVDVVYAVEAVITWLRHGLLVSLGRSAAGQGLAEHGWSRIRAAGRRRAVLRPVESGSAEYGQVVRQARMRHVAPIGRVRIPLGQRPQIGHADRENL